MLAWSQWFMKQREDECSFVSLRDVERSMIVFEYFFEKMAGLFRPRIDAKAKAEGAQGSEVDDITRCLLLAVSVCYQARLQDRRDYEEGVSKQLEIHGGADRFRSEIRWLVINHLPLPHFGGKVSTKWRNTRKRACFCAFMYLFTVKHVTMFHVISPLVVTSCSGKCSISYCEIIMCLLAHTICLYVNFRCQDVLLDSMELGHNIARNAALRENIFMMAVCIELRIPLFLVGKPGSSKSLAKSVVASSMHGEASNREFLRHFKQVTFVMQQFVMKGKA